MLKNQCEIFKNRPFGNGLFSVRGSLRASERAKQSDSVVHNILSELMEHLLLVSVIFHHGQKHSWLPLHSVMAFSILNLRCVFYWVMEHLIL